MIINCSGKDMLQNNHDEVHSGFQKNIQFLWTSDAWCVFLYLSCNECEKQTNLIRLFYVELLYIGSFGLQY